MVSRLLQILYLCVCLLGVIIFGKEIFIDNYIDFITIVACIYCIVESVRTFIKILRGPKE